MTKPSSITIADLGEHRLLRMVRGWFGTGGTDAAPIELGIGDDAAVVRTSPRTIVTTDALVENVHFRRHTIAPRDLGHKALAVNVSDLAAMAARPLAAFLALSVPPQTPVADLRAFFLGLRAAARTFGCPLAGGDLTRAPHWMLTITVLGTPLGRRVALRSAARPGDYLYLTGWPGESGAGLEALERKLAVSPKLLRRHRRPMPRLAEAAQLAKISPRLAMLDVSDGVWNDACQLAESSGVHVALRAADLPCSPLLARRVRGTGRAPLEYILFGGEDYELLCASPLAPAVMRAKYGALPGLAPLHPIGRIMPGHGVALYDAAGRRLPVRDRTFTHFKP
jgi:thiamine-monophosphate kinase